MPEFPLPQTFTDPRLSANISSPEYRSSLVYELFDEGRGPLAEAYKENDELWVEVWCAGSGAEGLVCRLGDLRAYLDRAEAWLTRKPEPQVWDLSDPKFDLLDSSC